MIRYLDVYPNELAVVPQSPTLPPVDWACIKKSPPTPLPIPARQPDDPLPSADVVILTWTTAEWSALDHVFLNNQTPRTAEDRDWQQAWVPYTRGVGHYSADPRSGMLWGYFQLVQITDLSGRPWRVLLFKSNSHLAHPPWITGLSAMTRSILEDAKPDRIYSIGTAGGARLGDRLGDAIVTNAGLLDLQRPENISDSGNGSMYRCPTWFPAGSLVADVERSLLYRMNKVVTRPALEDLFRQLREKHTADTSATNLTLDDLLNDPIRPENLGDPHIRPMKDVSLLSTDFYYIAGAKGAEAYSFLEMDDAVIAREAEALKVRYAFIRNVSDPIVGTRTPSGKPISDSIRSDWSGLIYSHYGLLTSYNSALATWAAIAGEGEAGYVPARETKAPYPDDPLEIKLVYQVRACGSCSFFWPEDRKHQTYGPYTSYDFDVDTPYAAPFNPGSAYSPWVLGRTRPPAFPEAAIVDGCRKAPIMTIGINPNLTAFAPGQTGTAWCYPSFSSDNETDAWAKYAWYFRYRTVYQERLDFDFIRRFILPEGQVIAPRPGHINAATRADDNPAWTITVRYEGDTVDTVVQIPGLLGDFPYVLLCDTFEPQNSFAAGDVLAGRIAVPGGIRTEVYQAPQTYYMQFVPVLKMFQDTLRKAGHPAALQVGEDVCQLDMVACASPHWNKGFLGGSDESIATIVNNCVSKNAWAMKQLVQTQPAILYIVSESSWRMFYHAFGNHVRRDPPLSSAPVDNDFTLLRETTDPQHPCNLVLDVEVDGRRYQCTTRLVVTPHFSYNTNFLPQYRLSPEDWDSFAKAQAACVAAMPDNGYELLPIDPKYPNAYRVLQLSGDPEKAAHSRAWLQQHYAEAAKVLEPHYYDPHAIMAGVLDDLYAKGTLTWGNGYLARSSGPCRFCVNDHWQLPLGCPYGKPAEPALPAGFLERVAERIVETGKPPDPPKVTPPPGPPPIVPPIPS